MAWPFLIALAGIAWLAYMGYLEHQRKMAKVSGASPDLADTLKALARRLEVAEGERDRLRQRVENLEAIVTSESFDLDRAAQAALEAPRPALTLDDAEPENDEEQVARMAQRVRGG